MTKEDWWALRTLNKYQVALKKIVTMDAAKPYQLRQVAKEALGSEFTNETLLDGTDLDTEVKP